MFPHWNIHKYTRTYPDGKTHKQIDHVLIDRIWHSSVLDVRSFRGADCDTDHTSYTINREWINALPGDGVTVSPKHVGAVLM